MYSCRASLLSCSQIPIPLPLILRQSQLNEPAGRTLAYERSSNGASTANEPLNDDLVAGIWSPQYPADTLEPKRQHRDYETFDRDQVNIWLCPEIDMQLRQERARRRKALMIAERMGAMVQAEKFEQQQQKQLEQANRGRKRKASNMEAVEKQAMDEQLPSPEVHKPQVLLVPELLPKGMWRQADTPKAADTRVEQADAEKPGLSQSYSENSPPSFDLGLDLGFGIAQQTPEASTKSAIMEITDFLEKDIDVFTPTMIRTPRSAAIPSNTQTAVSRKDAKQQDLINEILNFSL